MLYNPFKWNFIKILSNPVRSATHRYLAEFKCTPKTAGAETVHDYITLLADPQTVTTGFKTIDLARPILLTKKSNSVAGNVKLYGTDILGRSITETISLPTGATTIESTKAFKSVTKADLPAYTTEEDWIKIGTVNKIGLPALFYEDRIVLTIFDKAQIAHIGTYSKSDIALNILTPIKGGAVATFNDTKELIVIFIPCYEEEA